MGFKSDGVKWTWSDETTTGEPLQSYTTTYTTGGDPVEFKMPKQKIGDKIVINSPIKVETIEEPKGWICPRCGRVNAPWVSQCGCQGSVFKKIDTWSPSGIPEACRNCSNHPSNGGSGICHCTLGTPKITC